MVKEPVLAATDQRSRSRREAAGRRPGRFVSMTRALIADPYLPQKASGRLDDIRLSWVTTKAASTANTADPIGCVQNAVIGYASEWAELPKA